MKKQNAENLFSLMFAAILMLPIAGIISSL